MSRFLCCLCEKTLVASNHGQDVIVGPCKECKTKLRRELDAHCECFVIAKPFPITYSPRRAAA